MAWAVAESSWGGAPENDPAACDDLVEHNRPGLQETAEPAR